MGRLAGQCGVPGAEAPPGQPQPAQGSPPVPAQVVVLQVQGEELAPSTRSTYLPWFTLTLGLDCTLNGKNNLSGILLIGGNCT